MGVLILVMKVCRNYLSFTCGARAVSRRYCGRARLRVPDHGSDHEDDEDDEHDVDEDEDEEGEHKDGKVMQIIVKGQLCSPRYGSTLTGA